MKRDLRRIEATLNQLSQKSAVATVSRPPQLSETASTPLSFEVQAKVSKSPAAKLPATTPAVADAAPSLQSEASSSTVEPNSSVAPIHPTSEVKETLNLPKFKMPSFTSHRNSANPALASSLLKDLLSITEGWQTDLAQVLRDIQDLYAEGPIVDGWLESHAHESESNAAVLRHAEPDRLLNYVEEICATSHANTAPQTPKPGYFLCGLNADGQVWSTPCPPEQVPSVGLAIARHHKLRQLLARKQELENRLSHLSQSLVVMHSHLKEEQ